MDTTITDEAATITEQRFETRFRQRLREKIREETRKRFFERTGVKPDWGE